MAGVLVRDVPHRQRGMVVVPRRELGREGEGVLAVGRGRGTPGLPAAGPEGVAVLVDRQRLRVCVGEPGRRGGRAGGQVHGDVGVGHPVHHVVEPAELVLALGRLQPGPREDAQGDERDPGARHQVDVLGPGLARPLLGVVVATERQPVLGPPSHAGHPLGTAMGKSTETNMRLDPRSRRARPTRRSRRNRYKTTDPSLGLVQNGSVKPLDSVHTRVHPQLSVLRVSGRSCRFVAMTPTPRPLVHRRRSPRHGPSLHRGRVPRPHGPHLGYRGVAPVRSCGGPWARARSSPRRRCSPRCSCSSPSGSSGRATGGGGGDRHRDASARTSPTPCPRQRRSRSWTPSRRPTAA